MATEESFARWVIATGNRRFALVVILILLGAVGAGCFAAASRSATTADPARAHARAACNAWRDVVQRGPSIQSMDLMVADARKASVHDSRYTKLWSDMREYRLFVTSGVTTNTNYVSADCSDLPS